MKTKLIQMYFCLGIGTDQITLNYCYIRFNEIRGKKKDNSTIFEEPNKRDFEQAKSYFK